MFVACALLRLPLLALLSLLLLLVLRFVLVFGTESSRDRGPVSGLSALPRGSDVYKPAVLTRSRVHIGKHKHTFH